jgi:uncharacterized membrane protein
MTNTSSEVQAVPTIVYAAAAPILVTWLLVSFMPLFSAFGAWGSATNVLIHLGFFGIGAVVLAVLPLMAKWMVAQPSFASAQPTDRSKSTRNVLLITIYALVWMTAYGWFASVSG